MLPAAQLEPSPPSGRRVRSRRPRIGSTDVLAGAMWLVVVLVVVSVATRGVPFVGRQRHHAIPDAANVTASATPAGAAGTATAHPLPSPAGSVGAAPGLAVDVPAAALIRPAAAIVQRVDLPDAAGGPGTIVLYSSAAGIDGCTHPYIDVFRPAADGSWKPVWDVTSSAAPDAPLIGAVNRTEDGCFPRVSAFAVRSLDAGNPGLIVAVMASDGSQRLVVVALEPARSPAVISSLNLAPGLSLSVRDASPLAIEATEPLNTPASAGSGPWAGEPIGRLTETLQWREGSLTDSGWVATLNCLTGPLATRPSGATPLLIFHCPDGSHYAAAAIDAESVLADGFSVGDLRVGDEVQVALATTQAPQAPPVAARVSSAAAVSRRLAALAPAVAAQASATPARLRTATPVLAPTSPPVIAASGSSPREAISDPAAVAPASAPPLPTQAPLLTAPIQPPPTQTPAATVLPIRATAPARPVPPQPTPFAAPRPVPPQPQ